MPDMIAADELCIVRIHYAQRSRMQLASTPPDKNPGAVALTIGSVPRRTVF